MTTSPIDLSALKRVHTLDVDVRWRDIDELGHVNNSVYFTYFEEARIEWWNTAGVTFERKEVGPIIVTTDCTFLKPLFYPSKLQINVHAGLPGTSSYMIYYEIFIKDQTPVLAAKGTTKMVWVNYELGKALPLPESIRKLMG